MPSQSSRVSEVQPIDTFAAASLQHFYCCAQESIFNIKKPNQKPNQKQNPTKTKLITLSQLQVLNKNKDRFANLKNASKLPQQLRYWVFSLDDYKRSHNLVT